MWQQMTFQLPCSNTCAIMQVYHGEISSAKLRGIFGSFAQLSLSLGLLYTCLQHRLYWELPILLCCSDSKLALLQCLNWWWYGSRKHQDGCFQMTVRTKQLLNYVSYEDQKLALRRNWMIWKKISQEIPIWAGSKFWKSSREEVC